ncbi:DUF2889 domain-containing protein [Desulfotomaculum copahuensis]|uniref:DUF2889 domain-containing protein n=1 Tax=Desulfotomaculum copahuensis TaxID=1838280 RepID=A0A1B7LDX7_9FIRM|nr:DUF2889 domain-containing protein [Desulfotomaculum copahuensis]OAT81308.1 hypothetical protein A6M21_00485 [Desulfotomaculum copahuensis]
MLAFSRTKWVGVEKPAPDTYLAHGVLEDNIYGLELDVTVKTPEYKITSAAGKMRRFTTPECPRAVPVLQEAIGVCLTEANLISLVNRRIGREGCRHFANLLLECCDAILRCAFFERWAEAKKQGIDPGDYAKERLPLVPALKNTCLALKME